MSSMKCKPIVEEGLTSGGNPVLLVDKQMAVGNDRGLDFDTGCNFSGVRRLRITVETYNSTGYQLCIGHLLLDFESPFKKSHKANGDGNWVPTITIKKPNQSSTTIEIDETCPIVRIDVWDGGNRITALRFHFQSGEISKTFGTTDYKEPTASFEGKCPGSKLVGVHGRAYGCSLTKLGFSFASPIATAEVQSCSSADSTFECIGCEDVKF